MSIRSKKNYSEDEICAAIKDVKDNSISVNAASKKHKIPLSTLRDRLKNVKVRLNTNYSKETVSRAMDSIKNDRMSIYAASKQYHIPGSTLRNRLKGRHNKIYGSHTVLSKEDEEQLVEWILLCGRTGYPKTKRQIIKTAGEIAKIKSNTSFIKEIPTKGWFKSFKGRNPEISKRIPESIGKASASVTAEGLQNFFTLVQEQFKESDRLHLLIKPECWWNIDETGFDMNPLPRNVYVEKGSKTVHVVEKGKPNENITCTYAVCGNGTYIPPLITFKEAFANLDIAAYISKDIGANFGFNHTESGWMKGDAFYYFVTEHLYPRWLKMEAEFPIVLVVDGYAAHKKTELFIWCKEHDIILLLLYPNSTHIIQVLDLGIFSPLKTTYDDLYEDWKTLHPNDNFTELEFIKVLKATNDVVMKSETIINSWRASGLQPFEFGNVNLDILLTNVLSNEHSQERLTEELTPSFVYFDVEDVGSVETCPHQELEDPICEYPNRNGTDTGNGSTLPYDSNDCTIITVPSDPNDCTIITVPSDLNDCGIITVPSDPNDCTIITVPSIADENSNSSTNSTDSNDTMISFADLNNDIGLFYNNFEHSYSASSFGLDCSDDRILPEHSTTQIKKLVDKARSNIRQLGILLKVHDPSKMLNVLVMAQQLNIILPTPKLVDVTPPVTVKDILTVPTVPRTTKRIRKKLTFGVMSDVEIVDTVEEILQCEREEEKQLERDQMLDTEVVSDINSLEHIINVEQSSLKEKKEALKKLKDQRAAEKKESLKRKKAAVVEKKKRNEKQFKGGSTQSGEGKRQRKA